jgi:hypothetical protein
VRTILAGIKKEIRGVAGFPVLFDSTRDMTVPEIQRLRDLVNGLTRELQDPVWQRDSDGVKSLQKECDDYFSIVNALVDGQGNPVKWQLKLLPQESTYLIRSIYPDLEISFGAASSRQLTRDNGIIVEGNASQGLTLRFFKFLYDPSQGVKTNEFGLNWGLVRMIKGSKSERREGGGTWRFRINLVDGTNTGDMVFEGSLPGQKEYLPEITKWPRE